MYTKNSRSIVLTLLAHFSSYARLKLTSKDQGILTTHHESKLEKIPLFSAVSGLE